MCVSMPLRPPHPAFVLQMTHLKLRLPQENPLWVFSSFPSPSLPLIFPQFSSTLCLPHLVTLLSMSDLPLGSFFIFLSYFHGLHFYFFLSSSSMLHDCFIHSLNKYLWSMPGLCWGYYEGHSIEVVTKEEDIQQGGKW